jgi:hypothetical protein
LDAFFELSAVTGIDVSAIELCDLCQHPLNQWKLFLALLVKIVVVGNIAGISVKIHW